MFNKKNSIMSTETKKNTWKLIIQLIVSIATAIATTLGVTSCMGANVYFCGGSCVEDVSNHLGG